GEARLSALSELLYRTLDTVREEREFAPVAERLQLARTLMRADVLLVTASTVETRAVVDEFRERWGRDYRRRFLGGQAYLDFGALGAASVWLLQSEQGSSGAGGSQAAVTRAITAARPVSVIAVGIAFGVDRESQVAGTVLVSRQVMAYELQRVGTSEGTEKVIPRGDRVSASARLLNLLRNASLDWGQAAVAFDLLLSGEKLVDNHDYRERLRELEPEAKGGEMEGAGVYAACSSEGVDWVVVKAISDWADGKKKALDEVERRALAARNAAAFVCHAISLGGLRPS
ncbi:MAG: hypothetical protein L0177_13600, partial [Chloroflexi bacterium]|nr:hypothetical protein [Chloroflexota bacterium]